MPGRSRIRGSSSRLSERPATGRRPFRRPAPRGRAWRKVVYKNIGPLSSQQQSTALQSLEKSHAFIDPKRIGVWGWSGGGTETLNLMFRYPDLYSVGVSVASVPDQRLYDSIYQERYMGLPQDDPKAY